MRQNTSQIRRELLDDFTSLPPLASGSFIAYFPIQGQSHVVNHLGTESSDLSVIVEVAPHSSARGCEVHTLLLNLDTLGKSDISNPSLGIYPICVDASPRGYGTSESLAQVLLLVWRYA